MSNNHTDSDKIFTKSAFEWWYRVPDYQRPYVWGTDQVNDLLEDVAYAMTTKPNSEYFLGSIVLQLLPHTLPCVCLNMNKHDKPAEQMMHRSADLFC